jgi:hypothetical protein
MYAAEQFFCGDAKARPDVAGAGDLIAHKKVLGARQKPPSQARN